ncbi:zinc ribbon domain-containing protein, partial [Actinoplanes sp. NPDC023936]|uniref:zinc ribbon domain-containing protein n=1 Tax=Actinoplanes sp. NPDC023936 TaxID=3154910 RepID=UPI0033E270C3
HNSTISALNSGVNARRGLDRFFPTLSIMLDIPRARTDEVLLDVDDVALGHENRHRWNDPSQWVWSREQSHTPLISRHLYERAQQTVKSRGTNSEAGRAPRRTTRPYLFRGLITCGICGRRMVGNLNHGRLYYRCTASRDFVRQQQISHPPVLYLREDQIIGPVDRFLRDELTGPALTDNLRRVADAQHRAALAANNSEDDTETIRQTITDADAKIDRYRAALDAGDPTLIAEWITETTAIKKAAQARLGLTEAAPQRMTEDQLDAIVTAFIDLLKLIQGADPHDRAELYSRIGLRMTYQSGQKTLKAEVVSDDFGRVYNVCPRGDLNPRMRPLAHTLTSGQRAR